MISLLLLVSSYIFDVSTVAENEKNVFGVVLAFVVCIVLVMVLMEAFRFLSGKPDPNKNQEIPRISANTMPTAEVSPITSFTRKPDQPSF
jgi:uncharacterized membrane protein